MGWSGSAQSPTHIRPRRCQPRLAALAALQCPVAPFQTRVLRLFLLVSGNFRVSVSFGSCCTSLHPLRLTSMKPPSCMSILHHAAAVALLAERNPGTIGESSVKMLRCQAILRLNYQNYQLNHDGRDTEQEGRTATARGGHCDFFWKASHGVRRVRAGDGLRFCFCHTPSCNHLRSPNAIRAG